MKHTIIGTGIAAVAGLMTVAPAVADLRITPSLTVEETYSDNVDQSPGGTAEEALTTDLVPGAEVRWQTKRIDSALNASATLRHQTDGIDEGFQVLPDVTAFGNAEVSPDLFFVDAFASVAQQLLDTRRNDIEANRDTVQTYRLSPSLRGRFGKIAKGELRYEFDQILESNDGRLADSSTTHTVRGSLGNGGDVERLQWTANAFASENDRERATDVSRREIDLEFEYVVIRSISVIGGGGYQDLDDGNPGNDINEPTWQGGIRWRPGPRTNVRAVYRHRDDADNLDARMEHRLGPKTILLATYSERLTTGQERLGQDLAFLAQDPATGVLIDTRTGLPFDANTAATGVSDTTKRVTTLRVTLRGQRGRNTFEVRGVLEDSEDDGPEGDEEAIGIFLDLGRQLNPATTLSIFGGYERNDFEVGAIDNEYQAGATLNHDLFKNVQVFAAYTFNKQESTDSLNEFTENRVTVGLRTTF